LEITASTEDHDCFKSCCPGKRCGNQARPPKALYAQIEKIALKKVRVFDNHHENLCPVPIKWNNHHCGNDFSSGHFTKLENLENKIQLHIPRLFTVDEKQT